jgi:orotidine-5'-phosphate decarboxylase
MAGDLRIYERIAELAREWNHAGNVGLIVGATYPEEAARIRAICPDQLFLLPGVGAQAADIEAAVRASLDRNGGGILVSASRGVLYAQPVENGCAVGGWAEAARDAARGLRDAINAAR